MPNWVKHRVYINGDVETIAKCSEHIFKDGKFTFNNIIPRADELVVTHGSLSHLGEEWGKLTTDKEREEFCEKHKITKDEDKELLDAYADNIKEYGFPTWYEWSIKNWGTKWDACSVEYDTYEGNITLQFDTAWSTPSPIFLELSKQFPTLDIDVEFADEDLGYNCGEYKLKGGELTSVLEGDLDFACELWCIDKEDLDFDTLTMGQQ